MDGDKKFRRGDQISLFVGSAFGWLAAFWAYKSAYDNNRLLLAIWVFAAAVNLMNAMNAYERLTRRRK